MIYKDCLIGHQLHDAKCLRSCIFLSKSYVYVARKIFVLLWFVLDEFIQYYLNEIEVIIHFYYIKTISISILYRYRASFTAKYTNHDNCIFANLTYEGSKENKRFNIYYKYILKKSNKGKVIMRDPHLSNPCRFLSFR